MIIDLIKTCYLLNHNIKLHLFKLGWAVVKIDMEAHKAQ